MHPRLRFPRLLGAMLVLAALVYALLGPTLARGEETRHALAVHLVSPALSGDGKRVAVASRDSAGIAGATGSLAIFDLKGAVTKRIPLFPLTRHDARAQRGHAEAHAVLQEGRFQRLPRLARVTQRSQRRRGSTPPSYYGLFNRGSFGLTVRLQAGTLHLQAMKGRRRLGKWALPLATAPTGCSRVAGYSVSPAHVGLVRSKRARVMALSLVAEDARGRPCGSHDLVLPLR